MVPTVWHSEKDKTIETVKWTVVVKRRAEGERWIGEEQEMDF